MSRRRRQLIAAFAIFHVLACCGAALPNASQGLRRSAWRDPRVKDELSSWADVFGVTRPALEDTLFDAAKAWQATRKTLLLPLRPYLKLSGITQGWVVFVAGTRQADRFEVLARDDDGDERRLYLRGDDDAQWQSTLLESQAWRNVTFSAAWPDPRSRRWRKRMCKVLANRAFDDDAGISSIECGFLRRRNLKPGEGRAPAEQRVNVAVVPRPAIAASPGAP